MFALFEKALLTGLGALSLSQKMAEEFIKEMKEKYKVSEEEGRAFMERVQGMAKEGREKITEAAEEEVRKATDRLGLVSREEFELLKKRVDYLENCLVAADPGEPC